MENLFIADATTFGLHWCLLDCCRPCIACFKDFYCQLNYGHFRRITVTFMLCYTVSQKTSHLRLAIILMYTIQL